MRSLGSKMSRMSMIRMDIKRSSSMAGSRMVRIWRHTTRHSKRSCHSFRGIKMNSWTRWSCNKRLIIQLSNKTQNLSIDCLNTNLKSKRRRVDSTCPLAYQPLNACFVSLREFSWAATTMWSLRSRLLNASALWTLTKKCWNIKLSKTSLLWALRMPKTEKGW